MNKPKSQISLFVDGKKRCVRKIWLWNDHEIEADYAGCFIRVSRDEEDKYYSKPWYGWVASYGGNVLVDGWVGETIEMALEVCLRNIYFK